MNAPRIRAGVALVLAGLITFATLTSVRASGPDYQAIDAYLAAQVERLQLPGLAVCVVQGKEIVHVQSFGVADPGGRLVTAQTPFVLGSVSKTFTALAVMQLVEAGRVDLDAPVQHYISSFHLADPVASAQITAHYLLHQTSGIPGFSGGASLMDETQELTRSVEILHNVEPAHPPGSAFLYSDSNYAVLGVLVQTVSGEPFSAYVQRNIFEPLDMHHSYAPKAAAQRDGLASGYRWLFGVSVPVEEPLPPLNTPAGSLISSADDMGHFLIAQLNGGRYGSTSLLSASGTAATHAPATSSGYGMGWYSGAIDGVPPVFMTETT